MKRWIHASSESKGYNYRGCYISKDTFSWVVYDQGRRLQEFDTPDQAEEYVDEYLREE